MSKRYLVTGGTGFIGSGLVRKLVHAGNDVRVLDNNSRGTTSRLSDILTDIEIVEADIRDRESVIAASRGIDSILHLAYVNGTEFFYSKPELVLDIAMRGMLNVIDACRVQDIGELVLASSSEVYQSPPVIPTKEDAPLIVPDVMNPRYSYGGGKLACELMAINYGRSGFDRVMIFRPHNVYGPDMGWEHVIPQFALRAKDLTSKQPDGIIPFPILGDGRQTRAFCHIDDFIEGVHKILNKGKHLEIYHVGNPEELSISEVADHVIKCFGREVDVRPAAAPEGETSRRCPDISKLRDLGYNPSVDFADGIATTVKWYSDNAHLSPLKT
ncbi:NAD-dependent epimerase/dehydratase family protein [Thalassospira sp.]|uniref:NAD-dependent epimerase/dehydratase family protein n=1 Tax=Thalassospira sp. TaxID=1912094 RepID=UPI000C4FDC03|nr:NAD-dependent epimerase/dehydratase family protein [Thalassospira sp.]MBC07616.1 NAD-dependent dehydratase [Thalassospira sp.]|tara:strand:+ start:11378 stop:12361 length:984 start_codon:yes stop_codon:yes gene_type:complete